MIGAFIIALQVAAATPQPAAKPPVTPKARPIVVVDAGHGVVDRVMTGPLGLGVPKIYE